MHRISAKIRREGIDLAENIPYKDKLDLILDARIASNIANKHTNPSLPGYERQQRAENTGIKRDEKQTNKEGEIAKYRLSNLINNNNEDRNVI